MWKATIAAVIVVATGLPATATAAVPYDVWACRLPDSSVAPIDGWTPTDGVMFPWNRTPGTWMSDNCAAATHPVLRALSATFAGSVPNPAAVAWTFNAPRDTMIADATLWRAVRVPPPQGGVEYWAVETDQSRTMTTGVQFETCMDYQIICSALGSLQNVDDSANSVAFNSMRARQFHAMLRCAGGPAAEPCSHPAGAEFRIYRARMGLLDQDAPMFTSQPHGTLLEADRPQEGARWVAFSTSDRGGGIAAVGVLIDGRVVLERPVDPGDARCRQPYVAVVPCPLSATVTVHLDTASLANGTHLVQAFVSDVSGNRTTSSPTAIATRNGSLPNGAGANRTARLTAAVTTRSGRPIRGTTKYGRAASLRGRLTTHEGAPIAGAVLDVTSRSSRPGAAPHARTVVTGATGAYDHRIPVGSSRVFDVGYRAFTLDEGPSATATASLRVRAAISLTATPRTLRNGERVRFRGRLVGGPHRADATLLLYALGSRRIPVTSLRADASGRFAFSYRFRTVQQRSRFRFQVRTESRAGYPYAAGASRVAEVIVRP